MSIATMTVMRRNFNILNYSPRMLAPLNEVSNVYTVADLTRYRFDIDFEVSPGAIEGFIPVCATLYHVQRMIRRFVLFDSVRKESL